jgi:hypothetical protein
MKAINHYLLLTVCLLPNMIFVREYELLSPEK